MIGYGLGKAKGAFFDSAAVMAATTKAERRVLSKFGAFVRTRARQSIRKRKAPAPPGSPPSSHGNQLLKRNLFFVFEPERRSVVIGPVRLDAQVGSAPEALEHGGASEIRLTAKGGRQQRKRVHVEARPFMGPAYEAERPQLDGLWKDSIR